MFSLLLNIWVWLISNIHSIYFSRIDSLINTSIYWIYKTQLPEELLQVAAMSNKHQKHQLDILKTVLAKNCIKCYFSCGLHSIFILGDCLLISFRTPLRITLFFQTPHSSFVAIFLFFSQEEKRNLHSPYPHDCFEEGFFYKL